MTKYSYATGELLENRNSYAYSAYGGDAFIQAWRVSRQEVLKAIELSEVPGDHLLSETELFNYSFPVNTSELLINLRKKVVSQTLTTEEERLIEKLIQRFEVSKRIHESYSENWRPTEKESYKNLSLYVSYAQLMSVFYEQTLRLDSLNVFLKVMDTLCAYFKDLTGKDRGLLAGLIEMELSYIMALSDR